MGSWLVSSSVARKLSSGSAAQGEGNSSWPCGPALCGNGTGKVRRGVEYLTLRADGRTDLDGRATIETEDGHRIAMRIEGVATPRANEPMMDLIANVRLTTAAQKYDWVNTRQIWGLAT